MCGIISLHIDTLAVKELIDLGLDRIMAASWHVTSVFSLEMLVMDHLLATDELISHLVVVLALIDDALPLELPHLSLWILLEVLDHQLF